MAPWIPLTRYYNHLCPRKPPPLSMLPITLAFTTSFLIVVYMTLTTTYDQYSLSLFETYKSWQMSNQPIFTVPEFPDDNFDQSSYQIISRVDNPIPTQNHDQHPNSSVALGNSSASASAFTSHHHNNPSVAPSTSSLYNEDVFHDEQTFLKNYNEMKRNLKIYIYPHKKEYPLANAFLPTHGAEPGGNYASEAYFKNLLFKSDFITNDSSIADLFFLPFEIARLRHDRRVGVDGLQDFIKDYMANISKDFPYWNRTGGADHFYVACHSIGRLAMNKVEHVKANVIQVVCSSSYFLANYYAHKDVSIPQIWPRHEKLPDLASTKRKKLAFFAGAMNSPLRKVLYEAWRNDSSIFIYSGRLNTPYSEPLLGSKYCLHVKGFEVNTARIGDALYYGCVPVVLADYYDLPFMDILNWRSFSVVITSSDIPNLKKILQEITPKEYSTLRGNVLKVRKHFQWNMKPIDFDTFHMVMYELWLRRSTIRILS